MLRAKGGTVTISQLGARDGELVHAKDAKDAKGEVI